MRIDSFSKKLAPAIFAFQVLPWTFLEKYSGKSAHNTPQWQHHETGLENTWVFKENFLGFLNFIFCEVFLGVAFTQCTQYVINPTATLTTHNLTKLLFSQTNLNNIINLQFSEKKLWKLKKTCKTYILDSGFALSRLQKNSRTFQGPRGIFLDPAVSQQCSNIETNSSY